MELSSNEGANLAALSGAVPASLFAAMMPPVTEVWSGNPGSDTARMVRHGEVMAGGSAMIVAVIVSTMVKSAVPFLITGVISCLIIAAYEHMLRTPGTEG